MGTAFFFTNFHNLPTSLGLKLSCFCLALESDPLSLRGLLPQASGLWRRGGQVGEPSEYHILALSLSLEHLAGALDSMVAEVIEARARLELSTGFGLESCLGPLRSSS